MKKRDFVIVGSGGGGATIAWVLAKAGLSVTLIEQGQDLAESELAKPGRESDPPGFNSAPHDEYRYRAARPDIKRRPRGDYNTFRRGPGDSAKPFKHGWTGSVLGGGSLIWGTWAFRALPIDFKLATAFAHLEGLKDLDEKTGYSVADWPIGYADLEPYYNVAEALLAVSGDRQALTDSIKASPWFEEFSRTDWFFREFPVEQWESRFDFPCPAYPRTPVGQLVFEGMDKAGMHPCALPSAIVSPGTPLYRTREAIARALAVQSPGGFWDQPVERLWSERVRQACNLCGYCGEFLCWGGARPIEGHALVPGAPKSGTHSTVLQELAALPNVEILTQAKAYEVLFDRGRAQGIRFLHTDDPDRPVPGQRRGEHVILSCGAVQSARLLFLSGPAKGLGNRSGHLGRHACFHLFGMGAKAILKPEFQSLLRGELGHTGNTTSFAPYFVQDPVSRHWFKAGTLTSTAKKNPLENALEKAEALKPSKDGPSRTLAKALDEYNRTFEVRLTGDDLPRPHNRVDLDPSHTDEYGFPVARITRDVGQHEWLMYARVQGELQRLFAPFGNVLMPGSPRITPHIADLIGDHQMGTCRMGHDESQSVVNEWCAVHEAPNLFVVDSSFMPTGLGLNPMLTVVANALRVGTHIVSQLAAGRDPSTG